MHPSIQTKAELFAYVCQLHLEYPDFKSRPTYYQLARFSGTYWDDVGLDRTNVQQMPFERYHEYTNRLRAFLVAMGGPSPPVVGDMGMGGHAQGPASGSIEAAGAGKGGKSTSAPNAKANANPRKGELEHASEYAYAFKNRAFPHLETISLCSIFGHPTDSWMPKTGIDREVALVKVQRDLLWRWIRSCGVKHVCAHNGESALGLPWDERVERSLGGITADTSAGHGQGLGQAEKERGQKGIGAIAGSKKLSANGKDKKSSPAQLPPAPTIRLHLNDITHPPVMIYNAKMTWDMPDYPGRRPPFAEADEGMMAAFEQAAKDMGKADWKFTKSSTVKEMVITVEDHGHPKYANKKSAAGLRAGAGKNALAGPGPSSSFTSASTTKGIPAPTASSPLLGPALATTDPAHHGTRPTGIHANSGPTLLSNKPIDDWTWDDTEAVIERALYLAMHHGHMGVTVGRPRLEELTKAHALVSGKTADTDVVAGGNDTNTQGEQKKAKVCGTHGEACDIVKHNESRQAQQMQEVMKKKTEAVFGQEVAEAELYMAQGAALGGEWHVMTPEMWCTPGVASKSASGVSGRKADLPLPFPFPTSASPSASAAPITPVGSASISSAAGSTSNVSGSAPPKDIRAAASAVKPPAVSDGPSTPSSLPATSTAASTTTTTASRTKSTFSTSRPVALPGDKIDLSIFISPSHISSTGTYYERAPTTSHQQQEKEGIRRTTRKEQQAMAKRSQAMIERSLGYGNLDKEDAGKGKGRDRISWRAEGEMGVCEACGWGPA